MMFRVLFGVVFIGLGVYWLFELWPLSWSELLNVFSHNKAESQKAPLYAAFFAITFIVYGIFELINALRQDDE